MGTEEPLRWKRGGVDAKWQFLMSFVVLLLLVCLDCHLFYCVQSSERDSKKLIFPTNSDFI